MCAGSEERDVPKDGFAAFGAFDDSAARRPEDQETYSPNQPPALPHSTIAVRFAPAPEARRADGKLPGALQPHYCDAAFTREISLVPPSGEGPMAPTGSDAAPPVTLSVTRRDRHYR
jgi:hypothetical protein